MVLKLEKMFRVLYRGFGRREITWCSNRISSMCRWISSLEGWITWYSNAQKYTGNNEFGLEEGKITWYSNYYHTKTSPLHGLEEKEIAVTQTLVNHECAGLGKDEITWYLNWHTRVLVRFRRRWNYMVLKQAKFRPKTEQSFGEE